MNKNRFCLLVYLISFFGLHSLASVATVQRHTNFATINEFVTILDFRNGKMPNLSIYALTKYSLNGNCEGPVILK